MRLYRPKYTRKGKVHTSRKWWVQFSVGRKEFRRGLGTRDGRVAEELARRIVENEERRSRGILDPTEEHVLRPISEHVSAFETTLRGRQRTEGHVEDRMRCLRAFLDAAAVKVLRDLDPVRLSAWVGELRKGTLSARSINRRIQAAKQFGRWLHRSRRMSFDPFVTISLLREDDDRRRIRRALTTAELGRLLQAARTRRLLEAEERAAREAEKRARTGRAGRVAAVVGEDVRARLLARGEARCLLYAVAAGTGLRRGELRRLRWTDTDFDRSLVLVPAASAKSRRDQDVPLRADLAAALLAHRPAGARAEDRVFSSRDFPTVRTLHKDLAAAGIEARDESGAVVDFHSLRVTFVSALCAAGVHPRKAQALARHAKIDTTMQAYTDLRLLDLREAVESIPSPPGLLIRGLTCTADANLRQPALTCAETAPEPAGGPPEDSGVNSRKTPPSGTKRMAGATGLEPATSGLTGRRAQIVTVGHDAGYVGGGDRLCAPVCCSPDASLHVVARPCLKARPGAVVGEADAGGPGVRAHANVETPETFSPSVHAPAASHRPMIRKGSVNRVFRGRPAQPMLCAEVQSDGEERSAVSA